LAELADEASVSDQRQKCIDILCDFLRRPLPSKPAPIDINVLSLPDDAFFEHAGKRMDYSEQKNLRLAIIDIICNRLRSGAEVSWQGSDLDFTGAKFDGGNFEDVLFAADPGRGLNGRVKFDKVLFGDLFSERVSFRNATFTGGIVSFDGAVFKSLGYDRESVSFAGATFAGGKISFSGAKFKSSSVDFTDAKFIGGAVDFTGAKGAKPADLSGKHNVTLPIAWKLKNPDKN
jgi:uncharacterized protein YjbI with pentapeptide repeats